MGKTPGVEEEGVKEEELTTLYHIIYNENQLKTEKIPAYNMET